MMARATIACVLVNVLVVSIILVVDANESDKPASVQTARVGLHETVSAVVPDTGIADFRKIETLLDQARNTLPAVAALWGNPAAFGVLFSKRVCSEEPNIFSGYFNVSKSTVSNWLIARQEKLLANINIPSVPSINGDMYDEYTHISNFKLTNLKLKGLENLKINKFSINMCAMSIEIEMTIPKIDILSTYNISGIVEGTSVTGIGQLNATFHDVYVYDRSFRDCESVTIMDQPCIMSERKGKTVITTSNEMVYMSGLRYGKFSNEKIVNSKLDSYIKHKKPELLKKITAVFVDFKNKMFKRLSTEWLSEKLKDSTEKLQTLLDKTLRSSVLTRKVIGYISFLLSFLYYL